MSVSSLYGRRTARQLDLAEFLYAIAFSKGGMIVLPPKEEIERLTAKQVLGVNPDERTGQVILTVVPQGRQ